MTDPVESLRKTGSADTLFRRLIVVSTALSLATSYGWLAGFERLPGGNVEFRWRLVAVPWVVVGWWSSVYFWKKIWPADASIRATRREIIIASAVLFLPSVWWITFPLRFLSGQHRLDVLVGLTAAAIVLGFGAWMVTRLIKAFEKSDTDDLNRLQAEETNQLHPGGQTKS